MARRTPLREQAGLGKPVGKARRYPIIGTNETISYNEARRRIAALSDRQRSKVSLFERALGRSKTLRGAPRKRFMDGPQVLPPKFRRVRPRRREPLDEGKGRWRFEAGRLSHIHTFLDVRDGGRWLHAPFVGGELIAMQDWRAAAFGDVETPMAIPGGFSPGLRTRGLRGGGSQSALDDWQKANPAGVLSADGRTMAPNRLRGDTGAIAPHVAARAETRHGKGLL